MKNTNPIIFILLSGIALSFHAKTYSQTANLKTQIKMDTIQTKRSDTSQQIFIDRFIVPKNARREFIERMSFNRNFIKDLQGFIEDNVYERTDEHGDIICVTVAIWKNEDAIRRAKEAVQAEYQKQGFNLQEMLKRLNIVIDRGVYKKTGE